MAYSATYGDDNTKNQLDVDSYGIKISKPGYNVETAEDSDLIFSSGWASLPIAFEATGSYTNSFQTDQVTHGLGFPPLACIFYGYNGLAYRAALVTVDSSKVYISNTGQYPTIPIGATGTYHVVAFNVDLSRDVDYATTDQSSTNTIYDPDYGIKVAKEGQDITSTDYRDFILHSRCQSPLVLSVKNQSSSIATDTVNFTSPKNYRSWVFGYVRGTNGRYRYAPYGGSAYPETLTNGIGSTIQWVPASSDDGAALVVLRDPMFTSNIVQATY
jgi:hypothetical protein